MPSTDMATPIPIADVDIFDPVGPSESSTGVASTDTSTTSRKTVEETSWITKAGNVVNLEQPVDHCSSLSTIFRVPGHIRQLASEAYKPVATSFGPFHHREPYSRSPMQDHKWQCVRHLLSRHGSPERASQLLEKCLLELKKQDNKVRRCYSEEFSELNAEKMALIMLLDGCFIIYLMLKRKESFEEKKEEEEIEEKTEEEEKDMVENLEDEKTEEDEGNKRRERMIEIGEGDVVLNIQKEHKQLEGPTMAGLSTFYLMVSDVLKLENQIPFFIIKLLFDQLKTREDGNIDLVDLALQAFQDIHPPKSGTFVKRSPSEYHHLLHLFYSSRIPEPARARSPTAIKHMAWESAPRWTPSATELDRAGVKFETKEPADSFLDITFKWRSMKIMPQLRSGRMRIPPLQIYDYTGPLFQNLIAFEQCYPETEMYITIYALFMDCIIDQAEDVRLLHLKGILEHKLNNDQAVAELFNQLGSQIHFFWITDYIIDQIMEVITRVNEFYELKLQKWIAMLKRDYFGSPWAIISVLAAIILLLLTIKQAVFAGLSYFHSS